MSNFGNLTIEMFRFRLELCVLQWGILFTSSSLFHSHSHSLTMSLRYGWDEGLVQVLSMGKINRSRRSDRKNFGGGKSSPTNPTIMRTEKEKAKLNTACYKWYRYGGMDRE